MRNSISQSMVIKLIFVVAIAITFVSIYILLIFQTPPKPMAGQGTLEQENITNAIGGDFELLDQDQQTFSSNKLKGRPSLIYFGFTFCPDICPTSLQKLVQVLNTLDKYQIDVQPIFITVDPARDNPKLLKEYLAHFHPKFIGLTGSAEKIREVAELFKVYYAVAPGTEVDLKDYMVDHSSFIYYMDKNYKFKKLFYMSSTPEEIIEYIRINK